MEYILIIEDEKELNLLLAKTLGDGGYRTVSAFNGLVGLQLLKERQFNLV